jgi:S-adenosylmethionine:tRNA ribosyltransferase-isomerase
MRTSDFDYILPEEFIAQRPVEPRDHSRLMVLDRRTGFIEHRHFYDITEYLVDGDVLVFNDSRVIPARLKGRKAGTGGAVEILLLRRMDANTWEALVRPAKRLKTGAKIDIADSSRPQKVIRAEITEEGKSGIRIVRFDDETLFTELGEIALPPYVHIPLEDPERYQTIYARISGSVAAPTAGLHFTPGLLEKLENKGVRCLFTTLHVGLDTFRPVQEENPEDHVIHKEYGILDGETADELAKARREGQRIICVGTTAVRIVEQAAQASGDNSIGPFEGWVDLFILPGYRFRMVDAMITNYHLPRTTLLMLVTAFAGRENIDRAYKEAIKQRYRFYSFGDAMFIL